MDLRQFKASLLALFPLLVPAKCFQCLPCVRSRRKLKQLAEQTEKEALRQGVIRIVPSGGSQRTDLAKNVNFQADLLLLISLHKPFWYHKEVAEATTKHLHSRHV